MIRVLRKYPYPKPLNGDEGKYEGDFGSRVRVRETLYPSPNRLVIIPIPKILKVWFQE